jgi:hypothetical protein
LTQGAVRQVPYAVTPNGTGLIFRSTVRTAADAGDLMLMSPVMRVPLRMGSTFEAGTPSKHFDGPFIYGALERAYDGRPTDNDF